MFAVAKTGGFRYADGTRYIGDWNQKGQKHGMGHLLLPDGTRYGKFVFVIFHHRSWCAIKGCLWLFIFSLPCLFQDGSFVNGVCSGLGIMNFPDGSKYDEKCSFFIILKCFSFSRRFEGEHMQGWFHGNGIFYRSDGMKYEGEFRGGRIWGLGLVTFTDLTNGFPRNEGFFQDCKLIRKKNCPDIVQRAQKIALMARVQCEQPN